MRASFESDPWWTPRFVPSSLNREPSASAVWRVVVVDEVVDVPDVTRRLGVGDQFAGECVVALGDLRSDHVHVEPTADVDLDDLAPAAAGEEAGDLPWVADGRREADALDRAGEFDQSFEADGQLGPALSRREFVDLVDDHVVDVFERRP